MLNVQLTHDELGSFHLDHAAALTYVTEKVKEQGDLDV